jgi:phage gpG-like protein
MPLSADAFADMLKGLNRRLMSDEKRKESEEVAGIVRELVEENFSDETDRHHNPWLPRKGNPQHLPLRKSYDMFNAATRRGSTGNVEEIEADSITVGVNGEIHYAKYQQFGTSRIPAREYMYVHKNDLPKLEPPVEDLHNRFMNDQVFIYRDL